MSKSVKECCEEVANKHGFHNYTQIELWFRNNSQISDDDSLTWFDYIQEVAILFLHYSRI